MRLLHYTRGHVVPEDPRTELETTSQAWFERDRKCSNKACFLQQDINRKKREEHLYKRDHKKLPEALIWYGCGIFHLRLLLIEKYDLWTYPVECDNSPRAKSLIQFFLKKKEQGKMAAIVIMGIPVPWLQVHQSMRALRYGHQYGKLTLNCVGWYSSSLNEGFDSEARLIEGRLLVRVRQFQTLGYFATQELSRRKDENLEFNCPHVSYSIPTKTLSLRSSKHTKESASKTKRLALCTRDFSVSAAARRQLSRSYAAKTSKVRSRWHRRPTLSVSLDTLTLVAANRPRIQIGKFFRPSRSSVRIIY
jgi:hypothetical protein